MIYYTCDLCHKVTQQELPLVYIRVARTVPDVQEGGACFAKKHVCERCLNYYNAKREQAEHEAFLALRREKGDVADILTSQHEEEDPSILDGPWDYVTPYEVLPNEVLDTIKVEWQDHPGRRMTIGELIEMCMRAQEVTQNEREDV